MLEGTRSWIGFLKTTEQNQIDLSSDEQLMSKIAQIRTATNPILLPRN